MSIAPGPNLFRPCRAQREEGAAPQSQGVALTGFALGYGLSAFQAEDGLSRHRLEAVFADGRPVLILSREDFLAGLLEHGGYRIPGYAPASASALMTNILTLASQKKLAADTPTTRPATQPAP